MYVYTDTRNLYMLHLGICVSVYTSLYIYAWCCASKVGCEKLCSL